MMYQTILSIKTRGNTDIVDITDAVRNVVQKTEVLDGLAFLFVVGSTAALSTIEYEPGLVQHDIAAALEKIAPENGTYQHELTWHDDNGHSHVRATLMGPALHVPILEGRLVVGTWQQVVLVDFDTRSRERQIICQILDGVQNVA